MEVTEQEVKPVDINSADNPDVHLAHLLPPDSLVEPWYRTFFRDIKDAIHPAKLPPLEVTSKPIAVPDMWGFYGGNEKKAGLTSLAIHIGIILFLVWLSTLKPVQNVMQKTFTTLIAPD